MRRFSLSAKEIKGVNSGFVIKDCFFGLNGECYHIKRISNSCERDDCKFYRSGIPLKKKDSKNDHNLTQWPLELTIRRKRGKK